MAIVMLGIVMLGFGQSFFLRPMFEVREVPPYVLWHGVVMTLWFGWYILQTALAARGRIGLHQRMGFAGAGIGVLAIASGFVAGLGMIGRYRKEGWEFERELNHFSDVVWSNLSSIIVFAGFLAMAVALRKRPESHKRLMVLASMSLMGPAISRIGILPAVDAFGGIDLNTIVFSYGVMAALPLAMVIHDLVTSRRLHPVTYLGIPALFGGLQFITKVVPFTEFGRALIRPFM